MNNRDPFEMLSSLRPTETDRPLLPGEDPEAEALLRRITRHEPATLSKRRWVRRTIAGLVAAVVVGSGAIAAAIWFEQPSDTVSLACYSEASLRPSDQVVLAIDPESTPEEQCTAAWIDGPFGSGTAPPLTSCVTETGITAVIPGEPGVCVAIGLADRDPAVNTVENDAAKVTAAITDGYPADCVDTTDEAVSIIERILVDAEASDWSVVVREQVSSEYPCAIPAAIPAQQIVLIVSVALTSVGSE